ncbi:MAG: P-loop NTPase [Deltaproteobacteria bacterium]|nr:P-loop NTPase [Nannocystaceae bacterium]
MRSSFGPRAAAANRPRLWAIGGGKGGVGKSVVASNLAVRMAQLGHRVVIVDGDLGGANLDTLLGCERPTHTLAQFFDRSVEQLAELAAPTELPNLSLIAGDNESLGAANPAHAQKLKLIRHLRALPCDLVIVDLGAGTSFNTLDLYLAADLGIVVTTPEPTALQNCFAFIKTAALRDLEQRTGVQRRGNEEGALGRIGSEGPEARAALGRMASLVVNRAQPAEARRVGNMLNDLAGRFLRGQVCLRGSIHDDPAIVRSIRLRRPLSLAEPGATAALDIEALAHELWNGGAVAPATRTGFNEEVDHDGLRLHVQTEDLGGQQGAVRTQIFLADGSVQFTRRTPYVDAFFARLSVSPTDRMRFHHAAIVRALRGGRIELMRKSA